MENNRATFFSIFYLLSFVVFCRGFDSGNGMHELEHGKVKLFVFGDSYADTGNLPKLLISRSWYLPYGMDFPGKPTGRFSDGRVLTDYIASYLGIESPLPYQMKKLNPQAVSSGINFAYSGSGVFNTIFLTPNMSVQIGLFQQFIDQNVITSQDLSSSIALVSLAGNDYSTFLVKNGGNFQELPKFIKLVINELISNVRRIKELGITRVAVTGVPPSGCLPRATAMSSYKHCDQSVTQSSQFHNMILTQNIGALNKVVGDPSAFVYIDTYSAFNSVLQPTPETAGSLANKLKPCCLALQGAECGTVLMNGQKAYQVCQDPKLAFFWDSEHPSDAGWQAVYSYLQNTSLKALLQ